ncbi:hypothetical protein WG922_07180 [Ramlibacter sp. AN1015]|uniref:hypothetical protein n=1 Tax=Ramlibacter sp. AN1015 TaxID=3133428 RepID=UPI0030C4E3D7
MRSPLLFLGAALSAGLVAAQAPLAPSTPPAQREALEPRTNQKVERFQHEDAANRIDELRYGGQTQRITVQPKGGMPEYEVQSDPAARGRPADTRDGPSSAAGQRKWNVLRF